MDCLSSCQRVTFLVAAINLIAATLFLDRPSLPSPSRSLRACLLESNLRQDVATSVVDDPSDVSSFSEELTFDDDRRRRNLFRGERPSTISCQTLGGVSNGGVSNERPHHYVQPSRSFEFEYYRCNHLKRGVADKGIELSLAFERSLQLITLFIRFKDMLE
jgi:hypothetical protein